MDFLDELIDPFYAHQTDQTEVTSRRLGYMIAAALITSEERFKYESIAYKLTEEEAKQLCDRLADSMPQPGYHTIAISQADINRAIKYAKEKDDYYYETRRTNIQPKS